MDHEYILKSSQSHQPLTVSGDSELTLHTVHLGGDDVEVGELSREHGVIQYRECGAQRDRWDRHLQDYIPLLLRLQVSKQDFTAIEGICYFVIVNDNNPSTHVLLHST